MTPSIRRSACASAALLATFSVHAAPSTSGPPETVAAQATGPCAGTWLLCDDFSAATIDTGKWIVGDTDIAGQYPVRPGNVSLASYNDKGTPTSVVDTRIYGDLHAGPHRQGGLLITKKKYGGGRYEARMKVLPGPNGCSCMWNYFDSDNEPDPPAKRIYTEIDIEMPAHMGTPPAWSTWQRTLGFNTWSHSDKDSDATYIQWLSQTVDPFDGAFHVFRWDWRDGRNGSAKIDWYVDDILQTSTTKHVGSHSAQLWIGNWPAPWPGMDYAFDTQHLYIDWVRISALP